MNQKSEQLTAEYNIFVADDQPLRGKKLSNAVTLALGDKCKTVNLANKEVLLYEHNSKKIVLLVKAISYLGNPHPIFKKRIQIPSDWINYSKTVKELGYEVRFLGVYHYDGFVVFADFKVDDYLQRNCHNSSVHVYINDLYQGVTTGTFEKIDQNGNGVTTIARQKLDSFLQGESHQNRLLELFAEFNFGFSFGEWMKAIECIQEMHEKEWSQWRQTEWQGWFLEYKFSHFTKQYHVSPHIQYTALSHKGHRKNVFDFDIYFPEENFMGDLKTSDITKKESPGNDQETFINCINKYGKFWYIIYEHETIYDKNCEYVATKWRNHYIKDIDNIPDSEFDELSYKERMKNSVRFQKMCIIELNRINFRKALADFNQGRQPDGNARKVKFLIKKNEIDNFVIYRYNHADGKK